MVRLLGISLIFSGRRSPRTEAYGLLGVAAGCKPEELAAAYESYVNACGC